MISLNVDMSNYAVSVPDDWQSRAAEIADRTVVTERQAAVAIMSSAGVTRQTIASELGISKNTVDEHKQKIKRQIKRARNTFDEPELEMFVERADIDPEEVEKILEHTDIDELIAETESDA